ncbi:MAG TPA: lysophospholipid acyltransferase family protein [Polyangia bacterium]|jgi:1-acyl-sn-glycerol-3-phosphate acyltransferase|nr:lysophospholipid acyltransferase family protein [Polyangia bacterium]
MWKIAVTPMSEGTIRSALAAIYEAMRAGSAPGAPKPQDLPDGGHDPAFLDRAAPLLEFLWSRYFRVRLLGVENLPDTGAALLVANHSGGVPYDGTLLMYGIHRDHHLHRRVRPLVANFAFRAGWMSHVVARVGGVRASSDVALPLLADGQLLAVFPEGLKGVGKMYRERYRLTRFGRGGFARLARQAAVPMIPVAIVGAEEIHPVVGKITALSSPLGLPYIPITPTFPWLGPFGLLPVPTKWTIQIGQPIAPPAPDDFEGTARVAETVRSTIDLMISDLLAQRRSILFG